MSQETPIGNLGGGISDEDSKLVVPPEYGKVSRAISILL